MVEENECYPYRILQNIEQIDKSMMKQERLNKTLGVVCHEAGSVVV